MSSVNILVLIMGQAGEKRALAQAFPVVATSAVLEPTAWHPGRRPTMRTLPEGTNIGQVALVVHDLDRTMATWTAVGIGPWRI
jgi:hypothetical protein